MPLHSCHCADGGPNWTGLLIFVGVISLVAGIAFGFMWWERRKRR